MAEVTGPISTLPNSRHGGVVMAFDLMETLAAAAARGVEVTILTNDHEPAPITLRWKFWETRDSGWGRFRGAGYDLEVRDCDGDFSHWTLARGKYVLAKGQENTWKPYYHFDACVLAAEAALRVAISERIALLRSRRALPSTPHNTSGVEAAPELSDEYWSLR